MNFARCWQDREDCFAYVHGVNGEGCKALESTFFGERQCPFYKTREQREKELREHKENPFYTNGGKK